PGWRAVPRRGVRGLRGRTPSRCAGDPADGAGELRRDARPRGRRRLPAAAHARTATGGTAPRALPAALRDGDVPPDALFGGVRARPGAARLAGRGDPRPRLAGRAGLGLAGCRGRASAAAPSTRPAVSESFLFYDLETFGADPRTSRIAQFAAIRTDSALQPVEEPLDFLVRPADDLLPSPGATLVTGITPQHATRHGVPEADALARIHEAMARPGTCTLGYNSLRFDDEFVRHGLFRNFFDPYEREWRSGNCRWDLLDVMRLAHALRPGGIEWPARE